MRNPVTSERDAFRLAYGIAAVVGLAVILGALAGAVYGVVLVLGVASGALAWEFLTEDPEAEPNLQRAAAAARVTAPQTGRRRLLVVANETVAGEELRDDLRDLVGENPIVRVVCPILPSRAHLLASDTDRETDEAHERLDRTLEWAADAGLDATGTVSGDTPVTAVEDALRGFAADEILVSTHPARRSRWLESGLVERLRTELDIPVRHVVVDLERAPVSGAH